MDTLLGLSLLFTVISTGLGQYHFHSGPQARADTTDSHERYYREPLQHGSPPAQILSHKQAQNHDGNFKYAFAAENGLAQGEVIAPDGSRNGGYTYIDPHGKKISVKYTAGKEGFRILEGDHIPRAPPHVAPIPHPGYANTQSRQYDSSDSGGQYTRPINFNHLSSSGAPPPPTYNRPQEPAAYSPQPRTSYYATASFRPEENSLGGEKEPAYDDAPGKPHSFGAGYAFEFGG